MDIFKYIIALALFFAAILFEVSSAVALAFPSAADYAYGIALFAHSLIVLFLFFKSLQPKESEK
ncbi:MAG: hypothetical protein AABY36_08015 [Campylobacterota bacterium]